MTKEEILAMEAGEGLDKVVHEVIMGLCVHEWGIAEISERRYFVTGNACKKCGVSPLFAYSKYSTNISAAWLAVEKVRYRLSLKQELDGTWWAGFGYPCVMGDGKTAFEAICKAALLARLLE